MKKKKFVHAAKSLRKQLFTRLSLACLLGNLLFQLNPEEGLAKTRFKIEPDSVPVFEIHEPLTQAVTDAFTRLLTEARFKKHPAVIIEMSSRGAFIDDARELIQLVLNSDIPILIWAKPDKGDRQLTLSPATALFLASAPMSAASDQVSFGFADNLPNPSSSKDIKAERAKANAVNREIRRLGPLVNFGDEIAEKRQRNEAGLQALLASEAVFDTKQALEQKIIDGVFNDRDQLWAAARARFTSLPENPQFFVFKRNPKEKTYSALSNPDISFALMGIGALGLYTEANTPGLIIPGAIGVLALGLGALSMKIVPIRPSALILLLMGLICIALEAWTPLLTYGIAGILGALCLFFSGYFLVDSNQSEVHLDPNLWSPIFVLVFFALVFLGWQSIKTIKAKPYVKGAGRLINTQGIVISVISSEDATINIDGVLWSAKWKNPKERSGFKRGQKVTVVEQRGFVLLVSDATIK